MIMLTNDSMNVDVITSRLQMVNDLFSVAVNTKKRITNLFSSLYNIMIDLGNENLCINHLGGGGVMTNSLQLFVHYLCSSISKEETFLQDFLAILKHSLQNY